MTDFIGAGWAFPVGVDARGRIALARHEVDVEQAIRMIITTPRGQRVMRPTFGCHIHDLLFAPNHEGTAALAARYVSDALGQWEPRIDVVSVNAAPDPDDASCLLIEITYRLKTTNDQRSLVFPFYTIPGE